MMSLTDHAFVTPGSRRTASGNPACESCERQPCRVELFEKPLSSGGHLAS